MNDPLRRGFAVTLAVVTIAPLLVLPVRAVADAWRAPAVLPQSWGWRGFATLAGVSGDVTQALVNSVMVAAVTTTVAVFLGWPMARALGERRLLPPGAVFLLAMLPLLVSPYATGTGLATWFIRLGLADSYTGLVLAHLVYVLPYVVLLLAPGFRAPVRELEEAAAVLGAPRALRLLRVTVPAVASSLATAALLGFLVSLSQYGTSLAIGGGVPMLPLVLVPFVRTDPQVAATLSLVFLVPAGVALAIAVRSGAATTSERRSATRPSSG